MELVFLGTGGGRYATAKQTRQTGGVILKTNKTQIHIDPGPGALVHSNKELENPGDTEAVMVSHGHIDHYNDAEAIIELITQSNNYPGAIFANETVLNGYKDMDKQISGYHQNLCQEIHNLNENKVIKYKDLTIKTIELKHADPKTVGFKISNEDKQFGFWIDTKYREEFTDFYRGVDTLVVNCLISRNMDSDKHTSISDIPRLIREINPSTLILTHFGKYLLENGKLEENKDWLEEECRDLDTDVIFANDNMKYPGDRSLEDFS